jgi:hypothetical protein
MTTDQFPNLGLFVARSDKAPVPARWHKYLQANDSGVHFMNSWEGKYESIDQSISMNDSS